MLCSPGWPHIPKDPLSSALQELGLKTFATTLAQYPHFKTPFHSPAYEAPLESLCIAPGVPPLTILRLGRSQNYLRQSPKDIKPS